MSLRIGRLRAANKIFHGDGGNPAMQRRIRAHLNFIENTPLVLILIGVIEMTGKGGTWLAVVGAVFMLGRLGHAIGMDAEKPHPARIAGSLITMLTQLGLAVIAILIALGRF